MQHRIDPARSCLLVAVMFLGACAGAPRAPDESAAATAQDAVAKDGIQELYAGHPPIVHGTEFPVASVAEGMQRGDQAWRAGKFDLALYLYVQVLGIDSKLAEPLLRIASIHESRGNRSLARKAFGLALERDPANAGAQERLGLLSLQDDLLEAARRHLGRAVALDATRWRSFNGLGVLDDRAGDHQNAIRHYDAALRLEPRAALVMNNRGYSKFLAGDLAAAAADFRRAIQLGARREAWANLALVQARQRDYTAALESFLNTLELPEAYNALGEAAMDNGDYARAKSYFESASASAPAYFENAQKNLALANEKLSVGPVKPQ